MAHENTNLILPGSSNFKLQLPTWLKRALYADFVVCCCSQINQCHLRRDRDCCGHRGDRTSGAPPGAPSNRQTVTGNSLFRYYEVLQWQSICVPVFSQPPKAKDNFPPIQCSHLTHFIICASDREHQNCQRIPSDPTRICMTGSVSLPSSHLCVPQGQDASTLAVV